MKIVEVVLIVVAVVGSGYGDGQGGECPFQDEPVIDQVLILKAVKCLVPGSDDEGPNIDFLGRPDVTEQAREFFRDYCADLEPVKRCLDEANVVWKSCHDLDEGKDDLELLRDLLETSLEVFCAENGEKLVKVYQELQPSPEHPEIHVGLLQFMEDCMREVDLNFLNGDVSLPERIFVAYGRLKLFRRCFEYRGKEVFLSTKEISSLFGKLFRKIKCLHPARKTFVLCSTLNHDGTGDRECPRQYAHLDQINRNQYLIESGFQCFFSPNDMDGSRIPKELVEQGIGEYAVNYCQNITEVKDCLDDVTQSARLCLDNKTRHKVFEIFQEMLETSLEIACLEDGVRLTRIFFGNYNRSGGSGETRNVVGDCMDISVTRIKHVPERDANDASKMSLRMYQEVAAFGECLAKDIEEEMVNEASHTHIADLMSHVICVHPTNGESVPCKSIVDRF